MDPLPESLEVILDIDINAFPHPNTRERFGCKPSESAKPTAGCSSKLSLENTLVVQSLSKLLHLTRYILFAHVNPFQIQVVLLDLACKLIPKVPTVGIIKGTCYIYKILLSN